MEQTLLSMLLLVNKRDTAHVAFNTGLRKLDMLLTLIRIRT
ncbi:hypothetical protein T08_6159 [Trichinella sp. T8]|nr:hypothetical protein T08_6159 [Trichinella sp. T8]